jgi:hypothetical protein|tara:strand:- start:97 stop:324 length:228 start_codon:yes stop_codon:yes gene_type:complete
MFSWLIVTVWFEFDNKLFMEHYIKKNHGICRDAISQVVESAKKQYPEQNIKAAKCNDPIIWFKKYKLNQWDQVKD